LAWLEITIRIAASELARAEALLALAGSDAISISDAADSPLFEPEPGTTPLWPTLTLQALFDERCDRAVLSSLLGSLGDSSIGFALVDDAAVRRALTETVEPLEIGPRLRLVAAGDPAAGAPHTLALHMGLAFGTGRHPTTRLCLEWIEREIEPGQTVLDFGCGSGVLALAALRIGASRATAVDTEPQALEATRRNASLNLLELSLRVDAPDALGTGTFDVILANILAEPLVALAPAFAERQSPGGRIVLSGILSAQSERLAATYAPWYESLEQRERAGWVLLTGRRRSGYDPWSYACHDLS
jgi:ribosomal protein L11 methyltransferase